MVLRESRVKKLVTDFFYESEVQINGDKAWDLQVRDDRFYERVFCSKSLGLGEAYMDGWWECHAIDEMISRILKIKYQKVFKNNLRFLPNYLLSLIFNFQTKKKSKVVAEKHYDIGNKLYELMLDKEMVYSCGYWENASNLDEAQLNKLELACQKLQLKPGLRLLDIGCGWGGMAKYAAKHYGVSVVGITVSKEQKVLAEEACKGLPVEIRLQDYRDLHEKFDRVVSIGMFEHVGYKNYLTYMRSVHRNLKDDGIFLLHTIGNNLSQSSGDYWMTKYIFPNGMLPSIVQIGKSIEGLFVMEDWHNFGVDYSKTLLAWHHNFNNNWDLIKSDYSDRFRRMWNYYLLSCAGGFRSRAIQLWQIVLTKNGLPEGFKNRILLPKGD